MARSQITVHDITRDGISQGNAVISDAGNNHYFTGNDGQVFLEIVSTDGGAQSVDIEAGTGMAAIVDGLPLDPLTIAVPAGGTVLAGPFRKLSFNQSSDGSVWVDPSVSSTLQFYAFRLTPTP
jgi:hypothetical protein